MPWTPPSTIVAGQVLTAAYGNANIRDNSAYLKGVVSGTEADKIPTAALTTNVAGRKSQSQIVSVANSTYTPLYFDTVDLDQGGLTSAFTDRLTIPTAGFYHFGASVLWFINATGQRHLEVTNNGAGTAIAQSRILAVGDSQRTPNAVNGFRYFPAGEILRVYCTQTSGGSLSLDVGASASSFWAYLVRT